MNVSRWQIPPGPWLNLLNYGMRTKWTIFQACKYVTNDSARTIDSNHSDTMFHSRDWLWLYKLLASWTVNPCPTCFKLDQSWRIFVSVFTYNLNTFATEMDFPPILHWKVVVEFALMLNKDKGSRPLTKSPATIYTFICFYLHWLHSYYPHIIKPCLSSV